MHNTEGATANANTRLKALQAEPIQYKTDTIHFKNKKLFTVQVEFATFTRPILVLKGAGSPLGEARL